MQVYIAMYACRHMYVHSYMCTSQRKFGIFVALLAVAAATITTAAAADAAAASSAHKYYVLRARC